MAFILSENLPPPPRLPIGNRIICQTCHTRPIGMDDVNLVIAIAEGCERDPISIR